MVHHGEEDVNNNFRWACANLCSVQRENVTGVSVYALMRNKQVVFTEKALHQLLWELNHYPEQQKWGPRFATPDGRPAPRPEMVKGWKTEWSARKKRAKTARYTEEDRALWTKWKWSEELRGPLKIPREDPLEFFQVKKPPTTIERPPWEKFEMQEVFLDSEPLEDEEGDEQVLRDIHAALDARAALHNSTDFIAHKTDIATSPNLAALSSSGTKTVD
eukprot:Platyproteum_vivax@DN15977_c0_g1_i1.p2